MPIPIGDSYQSEDRLALLHLHLQEERGRHRFRPSPPRGPHVRGCGTRPCIAVNVYEPNGSDWHLVKSITITDDPVNGILSTPEGTIRYDPDTGRRLP